jgi:DNA-binding NarL/FixJ family response regulator
MASRAAEAAALFASMTRPYERAHALELAGQYAEAYALYESIGDVRDADRLRPLAIGLNRRGRAKDELTAREREVSRLVATGKSNRAIGAELVISERTVEKHLETIMAKVGVSSRTELAARLTKP